MNFPIDLIQLLKKATRVAVLTGAGVSQESGLRTFRDAQSGLWAQYRPEELATPRAFARTPKLVWDWYTHRRQAARGALPNAGHYALAEMEKKFSEFILITQNVDGLHHAAGNKNIVELHGSVLNVRCSECGTFADDWSEEPGALPRCKKCNGLLRPDVVWFEESLPREQLDAAVHAARTCQVFFSIGTSAVVQPAAALARVAKSEGAVVVEINAERTSLTSSVDYFFHGKSGQILPELVRAVWGK
jgi:NAD-dependent deacetylase